MRRSVRWIAASLLALGGGIGCASTTDVAICQKGEIASLNRVFDQHRAITVGEMHGTNEMPAAFAALVKQGAQTGKKIIVALEYPTNRQAMLDQFVAAPDVASADRVLTAFTSNDGRTSKAMRDMLFSLRAAMREGANLKLVAVDRLPGETIEVSPERLAEFGDDIDLSVSQRDMIMGQNAVEACLEADCGLLFYFAGNVHSRLLISELGSFNHATGEANMARGTPAGFIIADAMPTTAIYLTHRGGEMKNVAHDGTYSTRYWKPSTPETSTEDGVLYCNKSTAAHPYHLSVGPISAASNDDSD